MIERIAVTLSGRRRLVDDHLLLAVAVKVASAPVGVLSHAVTWWLQVGLQSLVVINSVSSLRLEDRCTIKRPKSHAHAAL